MIVACRAVGMPACVASGIACYRMQKNSHCVPCFGDAAWNGVHFGAVPLHPSTVPNSRPVKMENGTRLGMNAEPTQRYLMQKHSYVR